MRARRGTTVAIAVTAVVASALTAGSAQASSGAGGSTTGPSTTGPSTTVAPYVLPVAAGVRTRSLFTVGDRAADNGYRMVGVPDGLGAYRQGKDLVVLENQELTAGIPRRHGQPGAFVSRLVLDPKTGRVKAGSDLINPGVKYWDYPAGAYAAAPGIPAGATTGHTAAFGRFCSSSLTEAGQLKHGARGYAGQIYFANEETGDEGRAFGVTLDGQAYQLPRLGLFSWENTQAAHNRSDTTLVLGNEDGGKGQLRAYVGTKQRAGSPVDQAGLTNGALNVISVAGVPDATSSAAYVKGTSKPFTLAPIDWNKAGAAQNVDAAAVGTTLNRIEDGSFDPKHRNDYYFVTTEGGSKTPDPTDPANSVRDGGGLWRLSFTDIDRPELGGTLTLLLDGTEAPYLNKPDNITIDGEGHLLVQEDPGGNAHVARIVSYRIKDGALAVLAQFDRAQFTSGLPGFITADEESSGIIELPDGKFLFDAQVHAPSGDPETVEMGQLLTLSVDWDGVYGDAADDHSSH
ncbi:alkaline phosphatase PhoX [Pengzhenrongella phosphoraccumulans]|uniref:alkaline phosphatase PhoX n=1 Tax=Pengzhenrongella phosphoraccumulans TaxID=3114394 RepID=UPI00388DD72B